MHPPRSAHRHLPVETRGDRRPEIGCRPSRPPLAVRRAAMLHQFISLFHSFFRDGRFLSGFDGRSEQHWHGVAGQEDASAGGNPLAPLRPLL